MCDHSSTSQRLTCASSYLAAASITPTTAHLDLTVAAAPSRSADPTITALVQLGALRLGCERSFLSLIDGDTQYIVAEATHNTSLASGGGASEESDLFLGTLLMDKSWGICPKTMDFFTDETGSLECHDPNVVADRTRYIIKDLQADEDLKDRPYVQNWPYMRSYLEVPVVSPSGFVIGGHSVIHNNLIDFDDKAVRVLTEIAQSIMSHLEHVRVRMQQERSAKLIRALDTFIQEEAGTQRSSSSSTYSEDRNGLHEVDISATQPSLGDLQPHAARELALRRLRDLDAKVERDHGDQSAIAAGNDSAALSGLSPEVRRALARSAVLTRESLGMDGMVLLDASSFGSSDRTGRLDLQEEADGAAEGATDEVALDPPCPVLASSVSNEAGPAGAVKFHAPPQRLLQRLTRRFPRGQILGADQYGALPDYDSSISSETDDSASCRTSSDRRQDIDDLFRHFPQARSAVFLPLWHFQKGTLVCGGHWMDLRSDAVFRLERCNLPKRLWQLSHGRSHQPRGTGCQQCQERLHLIHKPRNSITTARHSGNY